MSYAGSVQAQLLSYQKGAGYSSTTGKTTSVYKIDYRQVLRAGWSTTFDYINEGHYTDHHADGYDLELSYWMRLPFKYPMSLSLGAGSFYYFDTITLPGTPSVDAHGFAPIVSATVRGKLWWGRKWDWVVSADAVAPARDIKTQMLTLGVGYWMDAAPALSGGEPAGILDRAADGSGPDELSAYGVLDVVNISGNPKAWGVSAEYRHRFDHIDATLTYLYEGDPHVARRSGVAAQLWPVRGVGWRGIEVGVGFGVYAFVDRKQVPAAQQTTSAALAPIVSLMASVPLHSGWFVRPIWDRVVSRYSRDADIWRLGLGRSF